jgi:hypothetical protein
MTADMLRELRLDKIPQPREAVPSPRADIRNSGQIINFKKALACVDALETAAFERFIPDGVTVNQSVDTRTFVPGWSMAFMVPTDQPVPMNEKVAAALKVNITDASTKAAYFAELGSQIRRAYSEYGARSISPPLVFSTSGAKTEVGRRTTPFIGVIVTFDRTPPDGLTELDLMQDVGVLADVADIKPDPEGLEEASLAADIPDTIPVEVSSQLS